MRTRNGDASEPTFWAAPDLIAAGYWVFPVKDKEPLVEGGFYGATDDKSQVAAWIEDGRGDGDIAVPTGAGYKIVVVDADTPESFAGMEAKQGPPTYTTKRGGHWLFRHPRNGKVISNRIAPGLDRKGDGGFVVVPPSKGRRWTNGVPRVEDLQVLPQEFWSKMEEPTPGEREISRNHREAAVEAISRRVGGIVPNGAEGGRHEHLVHLCGLLLRNGVSMVDAEDVLVGAWKKAGGDLADRADAEVPNALRTSRAALENGAATGGPSVDRITSGLCEELTEIFGWRTRTTRKGGEAKAAPPWPELEPAALYGLPGDIVRAVDPHSEADPVAVLASGLGAFGSAAGRGAFARVGADEHHLKLFVGLVGETAKGRKGSSWGPVRDLYGAVDPAWAADRVVGGLSSGEGLIHAVRDEVRGVRNGEEVVSDPGEPDKRLMVVEGELAGVLKVAGRDGSTLSPVIRLAWDGGKLRTMTKNSPTKATGAHVSIIGHVTKAELLRHLGETEAANGFANRFLWLMVARSKTLPFGGKWKVPAPLVRRLESAVRFARQSRVVSWGESAKDKWKAVYGPLSEGKPGMFGAVTGRAEAQVLRVACIYAAMDESATIEGVHLEGALALWDYAEESARYIFGDATGDPVADAIHEALRNAGGDGLTRTEIRDLFSRHLSATRIDGALGELLGLGMVWRRREQTGGRPTERWFAR